MVFSHIPQPRSFELPNTLTVMTDGLRWPTRGIISWLSLHGSGVDIRPTKQSCSLAFNTSEQYMAFRFKFDPDVVNGIMKLKHFTIWESAWLATAEERAWLSGERKPALFYVLSYRPGPQHWIISGPGMSEHYENKWTTQLMVQMNIVKNFFTGGSRHFVDTVETAMEILDEMRVIWVNAPVMLKVPNEKSFELIDITDQDPLFVALIK